MYRTCNILTIERTTPDTQAYLRSVKTLNRNNFWSLCVWIKAKVIPTEDSTFVTIRNLQVPLDEKGIRFYMTANSSIFMRIAGNSFHLVNSHTMAAWHLLCVSRDITQPQRFYVTWDGRSQPEINTTTTEGYQIPHNSHVELYGSKFQGSIAGLMIWDRMLSEQYNISKEPCDFKYKPIFIMHVDEDDPIRATFNLSDSRGKFDTNFILAKTLVQPKGNVMKSFIPGSYITLMRHSADGRPTAHFADRFQICEIRVTLASFGRKLMATRFGAQLANQDKFWSYETHLLHPNESSCYEPYNALEQLKFSDPNGGPVVALQIMAVIADGTGNPSARLTVVGCHGPGVDRLAPSVYSVYCQRLPEEVDNVTITFHLEPNYKICSLAFPAVLLINESDVEQTCCNATTQQKTVTYKCVYKWYHDRYVQCHDVYERLLPCASNYCQDKLILASWTEWVRAPCSVTCGRGTYTRTRMCYGGPIEFCQKNSTSGIEYQQTLPCSELKCVLEEFVCVFGCSCYGWSETAVVVTLENARNACFGYAGASSLSLQTENEEEVIAKLFGPYFQLPVWTSGGVGTSENGHQLVWVTRFDEEPADASSTVVDRIANPLPSYFHHFLTYDLDLQQFSRAEDRNDRNAVLCERDVRKTTTQLEWSDWHSTRFCDGISVTNLRVRFCVPQNEECSTVPCERKSEDEIEQLHNRQHTNTQYYTNDGLLFESQKQRCCVRSVLPPTVTPLNAKFVVGSTDEVFTCARGYKSVDYDESFAVACHVANRGRKTESVEWQPAFSADSQCTLHHKCEFPTLTSQHEKVADSMHERGYFTVDDIVVLRCKEGFDVDGSDGFTVSRCSRDETWQPDLLTLKPCQFAGKPTWMYSEETDYCYALFKADETMASAKKMCRTRFNESKLVSIRSAGENDFIKSLLQNAGLTSSLWTSGTGSSGTYKWAEGDAFDFTNWNLPPPGGDESSCVSVSQSGWTASSCVDSKQFICYTNQLKREGAWSEWSDWSACDVSKRRKRTRACDNPEPFCSSSKCPGASVETGVCCEDPGFGKNADRLGATGDPGENTTIHYSCLYGFIMSNGESTSSIICQNNGRWSGPPALCLRVECPINVVVNGEKSTYTSLVHDGRYLYEDVVVYTCELGFLVKGTLSQTHQTIECLGSGDWSKSLPVNCSRARCKDPGLGVNTHPPVLLEEKNTDHSANTYYFGDDLIYKCLDGFEFGYSDFLTLVCGSLGFWSHPPPECHRSLCEQPPAMVHSTLVDTLPAYNGDTVTVECNLGYVLDQTTKDTLQSTECVSDHVFKPDPVTPCERIYCGEPDNGTLVLRRSGDEFFYEDMVTYLCEEGYVVKDFLTATIVSKCTANGTWNPAKIECERADCGDPGLGSNAIRVVPKDFKYNAIVEYTCYPRYGLEADINNNRVVLRCNRDGFWNGTLNPKCTNLPIYYALDVDKVATDTIQIHFVQAAAFDNISVFYNATFQGINHVFDERLTKTVLFNHTEFDEHLHVITLHPGFQYTLHFTATSSIATEYPKPNGDAYFILKTGRPSFHPFISMKEQRKPAVAKIPGYNGINVTLGESFYDANGTIRGYALVVCETLTYIYASYYDRRSAQNLRTHTQLDRKNIFAVWPCYQVFNMCQIFDESTNCNVTKLANGNAGISSLGVVSYAIGLEDCEQRKDGEFCNGPLKPSGWFCVKVRAFTEDDYEDTPCSDSLLMDPDTSWRVDLILPLILGTLPYVILFCIAFIHLYIKWKYPNVERIESKEAFTNLVKENAKKQDLMVFKGRAGADYQSILLLKSQPRRRSTRHRARRFESVDESLVDKKNDFEGLSTASDVADLERSPVKTDLSNGRQPSVFSQLQSTGRQEFNEFGKSKQSSASSIISSDATVGVPVSAPSLILHAKESKVPPSKQTLLKESGARSKRNSLAAPTKSRKKSRAKDSLASVPGHRQPKAEQPLEVYEEAAVTATKSVKTKTVIKTKKKPLAQ